MPDATSAVLTSKIDEALAIASSSDAVSRIKAAVHDELRLLDRRAEIRETRFFNHTFYPDMFVSWYDDGKLVERPVYLRLATAETAIKRDLDIHEDSPGVFVGLLTHREDLHASEEVDDTSASTDSSLVTDAKSVQTLRASVSQSHEGTVATSALVRVGRGRFDGDRAESVSEAISQGFSAASEAKDVEPVRLAVELFGEFVDSIASDRLSTHLQLLWLASGGGLEDVFGPGRLAIEQLEDDQLLPILEHLLKTETPPSKELFRRFAQVTDIDKVGRLLSPFRGGNLDAFIEANIGLWSAKRIAVEVAAKASDDQVTEAKTDGRKPEPVDTVSPTPATGADNKPTPLPPGEAPETPSPGDGTAAPERWLLEKGLLKLRLDGGNLVFTNNAQRLPRADSREPLPRTDFTSRMADDHAVELELMSDEAEISLRRRVDIGGNAQVRADQVDQLGDLAKYVLAATVESPGLASAGDESAVEVKIEFGRGRVQFDGGPSVERAARFTSRYFNLGITPRTS